MIVNTQGKKSIIDNKTYLLLIDGPLVGEMFEVIQLTPVMKFPILSKDFSLDYQTAVYQIDNNIEPFHYRKKKIIALGKNLLNWN